MAAGARDGLSAAGAQPDQHPDDKPRMLKPSMPRQLRGPLFAILLGSACGGAAKPPARAAADVPTCMSTAAAIDARTHGGSLRALADALAPLHPYLRSLAAEVEEACTAGAWTSEVRACMIAATSDAELRTCEDALSLDQRHTLAARVARVTDLRAIAEVRDEMCACTSASCTAEIAGEVEHWGRLLSRYGTPEQLPEAISQTIDSMRACEGRFDIGPATYAIGLFADGFDTGVAACDEFLEVQEQYFACDAVPEAAKNAMRQSMEQQRLAWAMLKDPDVPIEAKQAAADGCRQGRAALMQSASVMGCDL